MFEMIIVGFVLAIVGSVFRLLYRNVTYTQIL